MKITYTKTTTEEIILRDGDVMFANTQAFTSFLDLISSYYKVLMTTCSHSMWKEFPGPTQGGNNGRDITKIVITTIDDHHHKLAVCVNWKDWDRSATVILVYKDFEADNFEGVEDI